MQKKFSRVLLLSIFGLSLLQLASAAAPKPEVYPYKQDITVPSRGVGEVTKVAFTSSTVNAI